MASYLRKKGFDKSNIAIIDADLIGRKNHRFPNLACMKISSYHKANGNDVILKLDYNGLDKFDKVYISKVFTDTKIPNGVLSFKNVEYGGTGFFYDKAPPLPHEIEHIRPDYDLYNWWVKSKISGGCNPKKLTYFTDYSIGFTTRGCTRKCNFCVNKNYDKCSLHSPVSEFIDISKKYICLLDDNCFACKQWRDVFFELQNTNKRFQFKQGLDERLLTEEKCEELFIKSKYIGDYIFAFDNIDDANVIEQKLKLIRQYTNKTCKFYVFCAYNHKNPSVYNEEFWINDIEGLFIRIELLMKYKCLPYIMRYEDYEKCEFSGVYTSISRWCNQPNFFKKASLREFAEINQSRTGKDPCADVRYMNELLAKYPQMSKYYNIKFSSLSK